MRPGQIGLNDQQILFGGVTDVDSAGVCGRGSPTALPLEPAVDRLRVHVLQGTIIGKRRQWRWNQTN